MDLKGHLRQAIASYGLEAVNNTFQEICKEDYEFLKKFYEVSKTPKQAVSSAPPAIAPPALAANEEEIPRPEKLRGDAKVRIVKKPSEDVSAPFTQSVAVPLTQPVIPAHAESGLTDPKDIKKWQKEQEDKKKRELDSQGINPASLLTKENLQKWIVDEKKTFAAVARDHIGLPDSMVSSAAKSYGIQSETSKRRAIIAASKRK